MKALRVLRVHDANLPDRRKRVNAAGGEWLAYLQLYLRVNTRGTGRLARWASVLGVAP